MYGIREIANWILDFGESKNIALSNMALNKLIYFAYEYSLREYDKKLSCAKIEAWEHGPVFREVYRAFKDFGNKPITSRASKYDPVSDSVDIVRPNITKDDEAILKDVLSPLIRLPASVLRELSHAADGPWAAVWYHGGVANPGMQITDDLILSSKRHGKPSNDGSEQSC